MRRSAAALLATVLGTIVASRVSAVTAREVLDSALHLDDTVRHWSDRTERLTLVIHGPEGERRREISVYAKRGAGGQEKTVCFIAAPADVKGVGLLQWMEPGRADEQWLYLPQFQRTRRIAASLQDERFAGTDFTFRDLTILARLLRWSEAEAPTALLGETPVDGRPAYRLELRPHQEGMPYGRLVLWLDKERLTPVRLDFYDRSAVQVKRLVLGDIRDVGRIPTPYRMEMDSLTKGSRTVARLDGVTYDSGLADALFTEHALERGRP